MFQQDVIADFELPEGSGLVHVLLVPADIGGLSSPRTVLDVLPYQAESVPS